MPLRLSKRTSFVLFVLFLSVNSAYGVDVFFLDNGLRLILEERPGTGVVALQIWVKVGSKYERHENSGITHFIEHLIFKGSKNLKANEIAANIEALGGSINAYTSYDNTVYHVVIPKESFVDGFLLLNEAVFNPTFPEEEIEKEKKVVIEEIRMGEDDPEKKLYKELFSLAYGECPYGRPIIGCPETVSLFSREDIVSYFEEHYGANTTTLVVVGDFEKEKVLKLAKDTVGQLKTGKRDYIATSCARPKGLVKIIRRNVLESYLAISYPIPNILHEDIPALKVVSALLTAGESSRLILELKNNRRIITGASSFVFAPEDEGLFVVYMNFKGQDYRNVIEAVEAEIKRLAKKVEEWELIKAKNQIRASYVYGSETPQGRARMLGYYATLTSDVYFVDKFLKKVEMVGPEDVKRVVERYISENMRTTVCILPIEDEKESNPYYGELRNGLRYVINRKTDAPLFAFSIGFIGGVKDEPPKKNGIFNVLSKMFLKGTKKKTAFELATSIDTLAGYVDPFCGYYLFGLSGKFMSKDFRDALSLLKEMLLETEFREEELRSVKNEIFSELRLKEDDPFSYSFRRFHSLLYKDHPYGKDPSGTFEDVASITIEDLRSIYETHVSPKNCVLAISGDLDVHEVEKLIKELFSNWTGPKKELKKEKITTQTGSVHLEKEIFQTHMIFGFPGVAFTEEDRFKMEIIDAILSGMGGRIYRVLREKNPYAYATSFFNQMGFDSGSIGIYAAFDPANLNNVRTAVEKELESLMKDGFSLKEIDRAKKYLVGNYLISMQSNSFIAHRMMVDTIYGLGHDFFKRWPKRIMEVTPFELNEALKKYLRPEKSLVVTVGKRP
ncbi:MAG: pitrilysin family protein [Deltaproteobacteria bacterium]|nr:pitrilysin family protein [Deltaproteobacteria bacterium]